MFRDSDKAMTLDLLLSYKNSTMNVIFVHIIGIAIISSISFLFWYDQRLLKH